MTTAAALTLQDVGVRWGRTIALDDITVDVPAGSVVGVLGRASAGRTTLVRLLAGRLPRYRGTASVGGVEASQVGDHPGLTYLSTGRWPGATGASVASMARDLARVQPHADPVRAIELLGRLGFAPGTALRHLSGAEQSIASACLALAVRARCTLLDEPDAVADTSQRARLAEALADEHGRQPRTWVIATDHIATWEGLVDRVIVLSAGRVVAAGPLEEVRAGWVRLDGDFDALVAMPHLGPVDRRDDHSSAVVPVAAVPPGAHRRVHSLGLDDLVTALTDTHWEGR
ncbi:ATP-binding cassette domain-containing protein [Propioniciclava flava]|uniref:ABC transporter domain-containing protein n=1 Tax=Propioniciclava flava TaxID=2072026 RepID=A0A4Q2EJN6_9ACTN|nr:ATP-binding cassette domain-containing protein [Propioniciclava flava]RXW32684.1 hypothetical protein C1706_05940 [Propioniciclava flava]